MDSHIKIDQPELQQALEPFLRGHKTKAARVAAVQAALEGEGGKVWRRELARWTICVLPVEVLVPEIYGHWRPLVSEAMQFVVLRMSAARLAPKVVEQMALAPETPPEVRLLRFIAKVPGLQKLGQVLARNRNLDPGVRRALTELENGISDVTSGEIRRVLQRELGPRIGKLEVAIDAGVLSEASVSAVVRFRWRNPGTGRRERGVFKVLKPYVPGCYAEDMKILRQLAGHLARRPPSDGINTAGAAETLTEIRFLLEHEVDFPREQSTLLKALKLYRSVPGIRVPHVLVPLSTLNVTALSEERGLKVTDAFSRPGSFRGRVAERLAEALVAVPALARDCDAVFHADPHAGNVLYDKRRDELVILDWALTERLSHEQRRNVMLLILMLLLRDAGGMAQAVERLCAGGDGTDTARSQTIRLHVRRCLDRLPVLWLPQPMEAMRLLDAIALDGIRFPASLLVFRKACFTLEGVLEDVAGSPVRLDSVIARYAAAHWIEASAMLVSLLSPRDWIALNWSAATLTARLGLRLASGPMRWIPRLLAPTADHSG